ncbi:MAG: hypothetical protein LBR06_00995 [Bacteroidales bacterium]|nr:hypothetical protein [Bacteroidales bacterium]
MGRLSQLLRERTAQPLPTCHRGTHKGCTVHYARHCGVCTYHPVIAGLTRNPLPQ